MINKEVIIEDILEGVLKCNITYADEHWIRQKQGASSRIARVKLQSCRGNSPAFITKYEWPSSSPDIDALDCCLWTILEFVACYILHHNIEALKAKFNRV